MVDAEDSKSSAFGCAGSSPAWGTNYDKLQVTKDLKSEVNLIISYKIGLCTTNQKRIVEKN